MNTPISVKQILAEMLSLVIARPNLIAESDLGDSETAVSVKRDSAATMAWVEYLCAKIEVGIPLTKEQLNDANIIAHRAEAGAYKLSMSNEKVRDLQKYLLVFAKGLNVLLTAFDA